MRKIFINKDIEEELIAHSKDKSFDEYVSFLLENKSQYNLTFPLIRDLCSNIYNVSYSLTFYKEYKDRGDFISSLQKEKDKIKLSDERNQIRSYIRKLARDESLKDIVLEAVDEIVSLKPFAPYTPLVTEDIEAEGILCLSDWHLGIECENAWNKYNEKIARERVKTLRDKVIQKAIKNGVGTLRVLNLGDMIAGRIHNVIRYESREDVITQIMKVSELIAELLDELSRYFPIEYYSCIDNHSNLEPKKDDRVETESLARIIDWYLEKRVPQVHINKNKFGLDIITFNCMGHKYLGVHGDHDRPEQVIDSISRMTEDHYDVICMAHRHHFSCDEKNRTVVVANSSLMGTDNYAKDRRLSAFPSQNLIIVTRDNPCEDICRILV